MDILVLKSLGCKFWEKITTFGFHWWHCWCCSTRSRTYCWMKTTINVDTFGQGYGTFLYHCSQSKFLDSVIYPNQFEFWMDNSGQLCAFICNHVTKAGFNACSAWTRGSHSDIISMAQFESPWSNSSSSSLIMTFSIGIRYPKLAFRSPCSTSRPQHNGLNTWTYSDMKRLWVAMRRFILNYSQSASIELGCKFRGFDWLTALRHISTKGY